MNNIIENNHCLACGSNKLVQSLQLGMQPLANSYKKTSTEQENLFPLGLNLCENCYHLQLTHTVDPALIYDNYLYVSGTSKTLKNYCEWFAALVHGSVLPKTKNILDIGCNDGTQLDSFKLLGYNTYGIDPAQNIFEISNKKHNVVCGYFGPNIVDKITSRFDAIVAQNVFAHNPNPLQFLELCSEMMDDHTLLFIQTSQADMVLNNEFDTIYHEHINFFNINSMNELAKRAKLNLIEVLKTPIHGNSYLFIFSKTESRLHYIQDMILQESKLLNVSTYRNWENKVTANMLVLKNTIDNYVAKNYKLVGYGAAAKGNTLLNFTDIRLDYIIDDNPMKQGLFAPGTGIPIVSIELLEKFSEKDRLLFIPLAWNFFDEIANRIKTKRKNDNDIFVKYFPKVEVVNV
jgi:2-polyprenyl-3-methyl-5-hydroxy-6-metoxy-1,4-benzoquinol methylase